MCFYTCPCMNVIIALTSTLVLTCGALQCILQSQSSIESVGGGGGGGGGGVATPPFRPVMNNINIH